MSCNPCAEKWQKLRDQYLKELKEREEKGEMRLSIICPCGLQRLIPAGLKVGDEFTLVPCPRCGSPFVGKLLGDTVERIDFYGKDK